MFLTTNSIERSTGANVPSAKLAVYLEKRISASSQRAYASDIGHFINWGGEIPCSPLTIANYVAEYAGTLAVSTLRRRLAAISAVHKEKCLHTPVESPLVTAAMKGIARHHRDAQRRAKPMYGETLLTALAALPSTTTGLRDRAILAIGYAGAFRRSELVALDVADLKIFEEHVFVSVRFSKTDQYGRGRVIKMLRTGDATCPVSAAQDWIKLIGSTGPLFRGVSRYGKISEDRLTSQVVTTVLRRSIAGVQLSTELYSAHSLRSGFATAAAASGRTSLQIRSITGHRSSDTLERYVHFDQIS